MTRLTDDEINLIEERCNYASHGPWRRDSLPHGSGCKFVVDENDNMIADCPWRPNTDFIANARQDIPRLLAEVKALRKVYVYSANMCGAMECVDEDALSTWYLKTQKAIAEYESNEKIK